MRRFLPLILTAGILSPTAAMAESTWLILRYGMVGPNGRASTSLEKIKVSSNSQCELMGAKWMGSKLSQREKDSRVRIVFAYECLIGE